MTDDAIEPLGEVNPFKVTLSDADGRTYEAVPDPDGDMVIMWDSRGMFTMKMRGGDDGVR